MNRLTLCSPNNRLQATIENHDNQIQWSLSHDQNFVIEPSPLGLILRGVNLGQGAQFGAPDNGEIDEIYTTRGHHKEAHNRCKTVQIPVTTNGVKWSLEARVFDEGFAFRSVVAGEGARRVNGETASWTLPAHSGVWLAERNNNWKLKSYAGWFVRTSAEELPTISSQGPVQLAPLVVELSDGNYAAITEAALNNFSGMRLRAIGERRVEADFTEGAAGFEVEGEIVTPWRVTMWSENLNDLVNSDLLTHLNPAPDAALYPDTDYIRAGRCAWRWWSRDTGTPDEERQFVEYASELGFEFSLVDDGWKDWPNCWDELKTICDLGREKGVGVLVWKDYKDVATPRDNYADLRDWLDKIQAAGASGVKIDFMNAESKDKIDFQSAALRETALRQLMVLFHGVQKPSGESRTHPHEITREAIRGLELNKMSEGPITPAHNAALPFTRFVVGHGDYTPVGFSNPGPTTWLHQLATAIVFLSPLQVIAEHPEFLLHNPNAQPALEILKRLPTLWDETRVLAPSKIGELAIFARRKGKSWWVAALNSERPVEFSLDLSFLGNDKYDAICLRSPQADEIERREVNDVSADFDCPVALAAGDGFVAVFDAIEN